MLEHRDPSDAAVDPDAVALAPAAAAELLGSFAVVLIGAGSVIMKNTRPNEVYMPERAKLFPKSSDEIDL